MKSSEKIIEKHFWFRLIQSTFRHHSTETALLKVMTSIQTLTTNGSIWPERNLCRHEKPLDRLEKWVDLSGTVSCWVRSYLDEINRLCRFHGDCRPESFHVIRSVSELRFWTSAVLSVLVASVWIRSRTLIMFRIADDTLLHAGPSPNQCGPSDILCR